MSYPIRKKLFEVFYTSYIEAAYFTEGCAPNSDFTEAIMSVCCLEKIKETCACFFDKVYEEYIHSSREAERFGHNYWLSRNGHGTGFFDCDYLEREDRVKLQELARSFGSHDLYLGDDGVIYSAQK